MKEHIYMTHRIVEVKMLDKTCISAEFQNGVVKEYDLSKLYSIYPQFIEIEKNMHKFQSPKVDEGGYGISWDDELDLDAEEIWENGIEKGVKEPDVCHALAYNLLYARNSIGMTQRQLAEITGIYQADISKIERGLANPSLSTINRLADGMGMKLRIEFVSI